MTCPRCTETLKATARDGVEIDHCPRCRGVWLDRGELDKLIGQIDGYRDDRRRYDDDDDDDEEPAACSAEAAAGAVAASSAISSTSANRDRTQGPTYGSAPIDLG